MPDLTMHLLFGLQAKQAFRPPLRRAVEAHPGVFAFGTQGPDLFFYHVTPPYCIRLQKAGSLIHHQQIPRLLREMDRCCNAHRGGPEYPILAAYWAGFLCHYFLDSTLHPYVCFLTEQRQKTSSDPAPAIHARIEAELDTLFFTRACGRPIRTFSPRPFFRTRPGELAPVVQLWQTLLNEMVLARPVAARHIWPAFRGFVQLNALCLEHPGLTGAAGSLAGTLYRPARIIEAHRKPNRVLRDTANLSHRPWHPPQHPEQTRSESVPELYRQAGRKAVRAINLCWDRPDCGGLPFRPDRDFYGNDIPPDQIRR